MTDVDCTNPSGLSRCATATLTVSECTGQPVGEDCTLTETTYRYCTTTAYLRLCDYVPDYGCGNPSLIDTSCPAGYQCRAVSYCTPDCPPGLFCNPTDSNRCGGGAELKAAAVCMPEVNLPCAGPSDTTTCPVGWVCDRSLEDCAVPYKCAPRERVGKPVAEDIPAASCVPGGPTPDTGGETDADTDTSADDGAGCGAGRPNADGSLLLVLTLGLCAARLRRRLKGPHPASPAFRPAGGEK